LRATFSNIAGLAVGGDVRIAGVKVGTVTEERIDPKTFDAIVLMTVAEGIQLPTDTGASITSESLLGGKFIALSPGGDETNLKPGQMITATQSSISLEDLLGKFIFSVTSLNGPKDGKPAGGDQPQAGGGALPPLGK
jgi:phospholipid/cholesterol/gamma-HCH transport system substrate-binding protein